MVEVYRGIIFYLGTEEESLEKFLNNLNIFHPTIRFTVKYLKEPINSLDINI